MVKAMQLAITTTPTTVINVPASNTAKGGGVAFSIPKNLTARQTELLAMAFDVAKHDGHRHPQLLQGIILQETLAGEYHSYKVAGQELGLRANERYYGVAQIKLAAARDVLTAFPRLVKEFNFHTTTDEEVIAKLIENDKFNLSVASKYLLILTRYGYDTIKELALAYNQGPGGAKAHDPNTFHYSVKVMKYIQELKPRSSPKT
jgi:hypothetical protein